MFRLKNIFFILVLFFSIFHASKVEAVSLEISPTIQHVVIIPGKTASLNYSITNTADPTTIKVKVQKLSIKNTSGDFEIDKSLKKDINFQLQETPFLDSPFLLYSRVKKNFQLNLSVPENILERDYYYGVTVETQTSPGKEGAANIKIKEVLTSLLVISVTKTAQIENNTNVSLFSLKTPYELNIGGRKMIFMDMFEPIPVSLTVQNNGNYISLIQGELRLYTQNKKQTVFSLGTQAVPAQGQKNITKSFISVCQENPSKNKLCKEETIILPPQMIGLYTIRATIISNDNKPIYQSTINFTVLPLKFFITVVSLASIGGLSLLFYIWMKYKKH